MKRINRWTLAAEAAAKWKDQHTKESNWTPVYKQEVYKKLVNLGANPNPDEVDKIIGNTSWTDVPRCSECDEKTDEVAMVGEEPDWESSTAILCRKCLIQALMLLEE